MSDSDQHVAKRSAKDADSADQAGGGAGGAGSRNVAKSRDLSQAHEKRGTNPNLLTPRQRAALGWLIKGATVSAVADRLGVERRTVGRWKKHPRFVAEVDRLCTPALPPPGDAQRVRATRVTPLSKTRRANAELYEELSATRPQKFVWMGVEYPTFDAYMAAIDASDRRRAGPPR